MVSLALGLVVGLALVVVQARLSAQSVRTSDISARDNEARAAMDIIARDVSGSGFLHGGLNCPVVLGYNRTAASSGYFAAVPATSLAARSGLALPFVANSGITLNYPASGSGIVSDVLIVSGTAGATKMDTEAIAAAPNAAYRPTLDGLLPVTRTDTLTAGDVGMVQVTLDSATSQWLCLRVPITQISTTAGVSYIQSTGNFMPLNFYAGFSGQLAGAGLPGAIGDAQLQQARLTDIGTAAASNLVTYAYYIDNSDTWPILMRTTINAANDAPIGTPQAIAAGVVSLQVLFGVGPGTGAAITQYVTGAQVATTQNVRNVRSIRVAVVTRSLNADREFTNAGASVAVPAGFTAYPIPTAYLKHRFAVQTTEIALRNGLWQ